MKNKQQLIYLPFSYLLNYIGKKVYIENTKLEIMKYFIYCKNGVNANQSVRNHNIILWNNDIDRKWSQTRELKAMPSSETNNQTPPCIWGWWNSLCWLITPIYKNVLPAISQSFKVLLEGMQILGGSLHCVCLFLLHSQSLEGTSLIGHNPSFIWRWAETKNPAPHCHLTNQLECTKETPFTRLLL